MMKQWVRKMQQNGAWRDAVTNPWLEAQLDATQLNAKTVPDSRVRWAPRVYADGNLEPSGICWQM